MSWITFSILSSLLLAAGNIADKYIVDKHVNKLGALALIYAIIMYIFAGLIFLFIGFNILPIKDTFLILLTGVFAVSALLAYYKALVIDEASRVIPLFQTVPIYALILGYVFLGEVIKPITYPGFILVLLGGILLSTKKFDASILKPRSSFLLMMVAAFSSAAISIIFKKISLENSFWQTLAWQNLAIAIVASFLVTAPTLRKDFIETIHNKGIKIIGLMGSSESLFFFGGMLKYYAITLAPVALVTVLGGVQPFFVFLYGILLTIFLPHLIKEELSKKILTQKLFSIFLIVIGAYLVTL